MKSRLDGDARPVTGDEGYALPFVIAIVMVMFMVLAALMLPLTNDVVSVQRSRDIVASRQTAETVFNELFAQAAATSGTSLDFRMAGQVVPRNFGTTAAPVERSVDWAGPSAGWARINPTTGQFVPCAPDGVGSGAIPYGSPLWRQAGVPDFACFYWSVSDVENGIRVAEVTVRTGCDTDGSDCKYRRFQQRWKQRSFLNYLILTDQETIAPSQYADRLNTHRRVQSGAGRRSTSPRPTRLPTARVQRGHTRSRR